MQKVGVNRFQIGDRVKRIAFTDSIRGERHPEIHGLTCISTREMPQEEAYRGNPNFLHYQRIEAENERGQIYEGSSRFFALEG